MTLLKLTLVAQVIVKRYQKSSCQASKTAVSRLKTPKWILSLYLKTLCYHCVLRLTDRYRSSIDFFETRKSKAAASHGLLMQSLMTNAMIL